MANYTVFRSDNLIGTDIGAFLASARVYDAEGSNLVEVENGTIVELGDYEDGEREVRKAKIATADSDITKCGVVSVPEVPYDSTKKNLADFINEKGSIVRVYVHHEWDMYSVTKEGFKGGAVGAKGAEVGIGEGGKLDTSGKGWGVIQAVENTSRYTYYVIKELPADAKENP